MASRHAEFIVARDRTLSGKEAMASRRVEFITARDRTPTWADFEATMAVWAMEQEKAKAAQKERKRQKALKRRESRRRKKEAAASAVEKSRAEIQAWWAAADKAGKENDGVYVWPECEK
jgi:hypothetical protein